MNIRETKQILSKALDTVDFELLKHEHESTYSVNNAIVRTTKGCVIVKICGDNFIFKDKSTETECILEQQATGDVWIEIY